MNFIKKFFQKNVTHYEPGVLYAPVAGTYIPLAEIPDPTFAEGLLGQGIGIEPEKGVIFSPADGVVTVIANTKHAIGITCNDGIELLIHIGLDTVEMNGEGFLCQVKKGQNIKFGQKLFDFDIEKIHQAGYPATVLFTVTNSYDFAQIQFDPKKSVKPLDSIGMYSNG